MNAREIEVFRTVMHHRTLAAAAQVLHVTQPALSKALRHCEDRLGYRLFNRNAGRLVPTAEANALIAEADRLYLQVQSFGALARGIGGKAGGVLRLGATSSLASSLVPQALARLRREFPDARIIVQTLAVPELETALLARRVEVGLALSPLVVPGLHVARVGSVRCVVLVRRDDPLASRPALGPPDLAGAAEVGFGVEQDFGRAVAAAFGRAGVERRLSVEVGTTTGALAMVLAGGGFAVVDGLTEAYLPDAVAAVPFVPELRRTVLMVRTENSGTPALTGRFRELLEALGRDGALAP
ncbi:LysR family transcriptional regulator [Lichenibacterium dinghuense]|uniref:LysR family transcriptional regulator n=1 Tax=Lichenibacterium dinghuense TaxID=2895977 RepID=UPI001F1F0FE2|nr:LysR substrate-binding domain-containing protein [Lichenibacterium sp. 6Y81]